MPSLITVALAGALTLGLVAEGGPSEAMKQTIAGLENELAQKWGEAERPRIERGIQQAAGFWRAEDGDEKAFAEVVRTLLRRRLRRPQRALHPHGVRASSPSTGT